MPEMISIGWPERLAGALQEGLLAARDAQRIGADHAHAARVHVAQALAEALQAGEGARRHVLVDAAILVDPGGQAHHFAQAIDDDQLAVRVARDHHVESCWNRGRPPRGRRGPGGVEVGWRVGSRRRGRWRPEARGSGASQAVKEEPHPQVVWRWDCGSRTARHPGRRGSRSRPRPGTARSSDRPAASRPGSRRRCRRPAAARRIRTRTAGPSSRHPARTRAA